MVFQPGQSGNPAGRTPGRQNFIDRAKYLMELHTIESLEEFLGDEKKFKKLSVYDAMILRRVAEAVATDGNNSMNSLLDRIIGKPTQHIEQTIDQTITISIEERRRIAYEEADNMLLNIANRTIEHEPTQLDS